MNLRTNAGGDGDDGRIELTPLIDVVFQLLIFFMVTMSFSKSNEYLLPIDLAEVNSGGGEAREEVFDGLTITVTADGNVLVNGKDPLTREQLRTRLRETYDYDPYAPILLRGDEKATHGDILDVLDDVKLQGFERVDMVVTRFSE